MKCFVLGNRIYLTVYKDRFYIGSLETTVSTWSSTYTFLPGANCFPLAECQMLRFLSSRKYYGIDHHICMLFKKNYGYPCFDSVILTLVVFLRNPVESFPLCEVKMIVYLILSLIHYTYTQPYQ